MTYKAKVVKGGKVSIPAYCRKELNIKEGEEIIFKLEENKVVIYPVKFLLEKARKTISKYSPSNESLVDKLVAERRREVENE